MRTFFKKAEVVWKNNMSQRDSKLSIKNDYVLRIQKDFRRAVMPQSQIKKSVKYTPDYQA